MSILNLLNNIIRKAERPLYSADEVRRYKQKLAETNGVRRRKGRQTLAEKHFDAILKFANSDNPRLRKEGDKALKAALDPEATVAVILAILLIGNRLFRELGLISAGIKRNVNLITTIPSTRKPLIVNYIWRRVIADQPLKTAAFAKWLYEQFEISEGRAKLIAEDQAMKLEGLKEEARNKARGVEAYMWVSMRDHKVRAEHVERDGRIYRYDDKTLDPNHHPPPRANNCRCKAVPIITRLNN